MPTKTKIKKQKNKLVPLVNDLRDDVARLENLLLRSQHNETGLRERVNVITEENKFYKNSAMDGINEKNNTINLLTEIIRWQIKPETAQDPFNRMKKARLDKELYPPMNTMSCSNKDSNRF